MRFGVVVFPGTWSDLDCQHVLGEILNHPAEKVWHQETNLSGYDCIILPGGFSYGDYLRCGAIARFSPIMQSLEEFAQKGGLVWGICNGFQILCEAGLLPGVLIRNSHLQYRCQWTTIRVENTATPFTRHCSPGQLLQIPISHGEGNYQTDPETLAHLERNGQIVLRYVNQNGETSSLGNPNGSLNNIAGIVNEHGNVLGMRPHPERCCEQLLGGEDGLFLFRSVLQELY